MAVILGSGTYRYEVVDNWAKLPPGREFNADVAAVGVDAQDRVYAFNRGAHPMCVFDRDGNFLRSWGEGVFRRAHGVHVAPDDTLWLTDDGDHTVRHCTLDGKVLFRLSGISVYPAEQRARAGTTLAVMTPAAFQEFARSAAAVLEPRLDDQHLREGLGLVIFGSVLAFGPADARPLRSESISVLRHVL